MAMTSGGSGSGPSSDMNVTPLIDVLLVLLIIFMVITPLTPKGLDALVPQPPPPNAPKNQAPDRTIVVQVLDKGAGQAPGLKINQDDVSWDNLQQRLTDIYKARAEKVMFVKGDTGIPFADVANVIDIAHAAGVDKVWPDYGQNRSWRLVRYSSVCGGALCRGYNAPVQQWRGIWLTYGSSYGPRPAVFVCRHIREILSIVVQGGTNTHNEENCESAGIGIGRPGPDFRHGMQ